MKYLFLIILIVGLVSCGKKTQLKVTAKNAATGEGYAGLGYLLKEVKPYTTSTGEVQKTVYEGTLNQQGEAVFEYKLKDRSYIITTLVPEEELCYINNTSYTLHRDDNNLKFDFRFAECGYLKTHVYNVDCQDSNDRILFDFEPTYIEDYSNIIPKEEFGCYNNEFVSSKVPYGSWQATWEVTKNGSTTYYDSLFYINEGEEYIFEINY